MKLTYTHEAKDKIRKLPPETKKGIQKLLELLPETPFLGKPLQKELAGYYSLRFKNNRVIYKVTLNSKNIVIYTLGHRKDVYENFLKQLHKFQ